MRYVCVRQGYVQSTKIDIAVSLQISNGKCYARIRLPRNYPSTAVLTAQGIICTAYLTFGKQWPWKQYAKHAAMYDNTIRIHHFMRHDKDIPKQKDESDLFENIGFLLLSTCIRLIAKKLHNKTNKTRTVGVFLEASGSVRNAIQKEHAFHLFTRLTKRQLLSRLKYNGLCDVPRARLIPFQKDLVDQEDQELLVHYYTSHFGLDVLENDSCVSFMGASLDCVLHSIEKKHIKKII